MQAMAVDEAHHSTFLHNWVSFQSFIHRGGSRVGLCRVPAMEFSFMTLLISFSLLALGTHASRELAADGHRSLVAADYYSWFPGHSTFYGGADASGTAGGACGYQNPFSLGYGQLTAAISDMIYHGGLACGACFEVKCVGDPKCYSSTVVVTATNESPQYTTATLGPHFDLSQPAFNTIAQEILGNMIIQYRRVTCQKQGGIRYQIGGQTYWMSVLVYNVGGVGDVQTMSVKGSNTNWISLQHLWGQTWCTGQVLNGQAMSFSTTTSDGRTLDNNNVANSGWTYGRTYEGSQY